MEATLKGPYGQTHLEPTPYPYTIGRAPENLLVVNDPKVSSHHAQIRPEGQGYDIVDLGSSNGTFVNEQRLVPNVPRLLYTGDQVRIGDTMFVYEAGAMSQPFGESTVYGGFSQGSTPSYSPVVATPPPYRADSYGAPQGGYAPYSPAPAPTPVPVQKSSRRGLWIALSAIVGVLVLGAIVFGVIGYANRSTPTKTLNAFCSALKSGDYQAAYDQLSSSAKSQETEAQFAANFKSVKLTACTVSNVNDTAGSGTITYGVSNGNSTVQVVLDYTLVKENGSWKINSEQKHT